MFEETCVAVANAAKGKVNFLQKKPVGYFLMSILAGMFIGFGILLIFTIGGMLDGQPYTKIVMGVSFGIALSLVVIAGAELFTGNNMVMAGGLMNRTVSFGSAVKLWIVCFLGNWVGSVLLALIFYFAGLTEGDTGAFMAAGAMGKMSLPFVPLLMRAILCNMLVCLAAWCGFKCTSDSGKLIMIFWCLFAFITTGFEHSVANMTLLTVSLLEPAGQAVSIGGYLYNLGVVTLGNMIGGILLVAVPYFVASRKKEA